MKPRIVLVDDEVRMAEAMSAALERAGYESATFASGEAALAAVLDQGADAVVTDWRMNGMNGLEVLRRLRGAGATVPVILVTAYGDIPSAVQAMHEGAFDYVTKPFDNDELRGLVARALELTRLRRDNQERRRQLAGRDGWDVVAESDAMKTVLALVDRAAPSRATVLITGESGTGKEVVARRIHVGSERPRGPFVAVNCRAFADTVLESELFGHEKGAFTGAITAHAGCFERANGGTLLLDEIGDVGPGFQAKLLRVIREGEVQRVGATRPRRIDVRLIAATNRDLQAEVAGGRFREDLFFRLNVIPVVVPPLRERRADVLPLARHFLKRHADESGRQVGLSDGAGECLQAHAWPGSVRELDQVEVVREPEGGVAFFVAARSVAPVPLVPADPLASRDALAAFLERFEMTHVFAGPATRISLASTRSRPELNSGNRPRSPTRVHTSCGRAFSRNRTRFRSGLEIRVRTSGMVDMGRSSIFVAATASPRPWSSSSRGGPDRRRARRAAAAPAVRSGLPSRLRREGDGRAARRRDDRRSTVSCTRRSTRSPGTSKPRVSRTSTIWLVFPSIRSGRSAR